MKRFKIFSCVIAVVCGIILASEEVSAQTSTGRFTINMKHGKVWMNIGRKPETKQEPVKREQNSENQTQSKPALTDNKQVVVKNESYTSSKNTSGSALKYNVNDKTLTYGDHVYSFVEVEKLTFMMGATNEQQGEAETAESPAHRVSVLTFKLGTTEVPQWLWTAVMDNNPSENVGENNPVENVSWYDCQEFLKRLSEMTGGKVFSLPTEAQMELALRNRQSSSPYKYGTVDELDDIAWYSGNSNGGTHPVGMKKANDLGLYDIIGNVGEWCSDWFGIYQPTGTVEQIAPKGPENGVQKVYRSAAYDSNAKDCRTTSRFAAAPDTRSPRIGFRLAF